MTDKEALEAYLKKLKEVKYPDLSIRAIIYGIEERLKHMKND